MMEQSSFLDRIFHSTAGRILIALLQTFLVSMLTLLVFTAANGLEILLLKYTVVLFIGLAAGYSARRSLPGHTRLLQILTALLAAALSLSVQYILSKGFIGIHPFPETSRYPDWESLLQLGIAFLGITLVIFSFRKSRAVPETPPPAPPIQEAVSIPASEKRSWLPNLRLSTLTKGQANSARVALRGSRSRIGARSSSPREKAIIKAQPAKLTLSAPPSAVIKKPTRSKRRKSSPEIKFVGKEEHFCPYCLDKVEEHDPRGVKICPICKTWHHADCWGITGACQIPHLNDK